MFVVSFNNIYANDYVHLGLMYAIYERNVIAGSYTVNDLRKTRLFHFLQQNVIITNPANSIYLCFYLDQGKSHYFYIAI